MAAPVRYNLVTFKLDEGGAELALTPSGPFTIATGLRPSVTTFGVPYTEYAKLGDKPTQRGSLRFWYLKAPSAQTTPDVEYKSMRIVEVIPGPIGVVQGQTTPMVYEYTLGIEDIRERAIPPRGGRVNLGLIDPTLPQAVPATENGKAVTPPPAAKTVRELMRLCLKQMYPKFEVIDFQDQMLKAGPPANLQWYNAYSAVELQKLIDHASAVACPQTSGAVLIRNIGHGEDVKIPKGWQLASATLPEVDRRGQVVIFTSAPNPVIETQAVPGPSPLTWEFVIQDTKGVWREINDTELRKAPHNLIAAGGPEATVRGHYAIPNTKYTDHVRRQLYHCVRLTKQFHKGQMRILRRMASFLIEGNNEPKMKVRDLEVLANRAVLDANTRLWTNAITEPATCTATHLDAANNILYVHELLGRVLVDGDPAKPASDLEAAFDPLQDGDLLVNLSVESALELKDEPGKWVPEYFNVGYRRGPSNLLGELDPDSLAAELLQPGEDTVIISKPELRLLRAIATSNTPPLDNTRQLKDKALKLAVRYLVEKQPALVIRIQGWLKVELSGTVSEVTLDPGTPGGEGPTTTVKKFAHWTPLGPESVLRLGRSVGAPGGGGGGEAYPEQVETLNHALSVGGAGPSQPLVPLTPPPPTPLPNGLAVVQLEKVGGTAGNKTTPASFTYDVYLDPHASGQPAILKGASPRWARSNGLMVPGHIGLAFVENGNWQLLVCDETPGTGGC